MLGGIASRLGGFRTERSALLVATDGEYIAAVSRDASGSSHVTVACASDLSVPPLGKLSCVELTQIMRCHAAASKTAVMPSMMPAVLQTHLQQRPPSAITFGRSKDEGFPPRLCVGARDSCVLWDIADCFASAASGATPLVSSIQHLCIPDEAHFDVIAKIFEGIVLLRVGLDGSSCPPKQQKSELTWMRGLLIIIAGTPRAHDGSRSYRCTRHERRMPFRGHMPRVSPFSTLLPTLPSPPSLLPYFSPDPPRTVSLRYQVIPNSPPPSFQRSSHWMMSFIPRN